MMLACLAVCVRCPCVCPVTQVMYAADWFLTLFSRAMPQHFVLRVFDVVFGETEYV